MMDNSNTNDYPILGTFVNSDASGIIARSSQIYDAVANKSVEERISDLDEKIGSGSAASNVTYNHNDSKLDATNMQQAIDEVYSKVNTNRENDKTELEKSISDNKSTIDNSIQDVYKKSNYNDGDNIIDFNTIHLIKDNAVWLLLFVDSNNKFVYGITRKDGQPHWGVGVPKVIKDYVNKQIDGILGTNNVTETIDSLKEIEKFLADFKNSDTLKALLDTKANKIDVNTAIANVNDTVADKYKKSNPNDNEGNIVDTNTILKVTNNKKYIQLLTDVVGKIYEAVDKNGVRNFFTPVNIQESEIKVTNSNKFSLIFIDNKERPFAWFKKNGEFDYYEGIPTPIKKYVKDTSIPIVKDVLNSNVFLRNQDKFPALYSACRYTTETKDFQLEIITDTHESRLALKNAVEVCNGFDTIDAIIHCGDIVAYCQQREKGFAEEQVSNMSKSTKPWLITIGNHDIGEAIYAVDGTNHETAYKLYIKPMIDAGILKEGEYQEGKCYYYHDFVSSKYNQNIRVIVLYDYDQPMDIADNDYWDTVEYNSSYPQIQARQYIYSADNPIYVNCGEYKEHSFKLKKSVNVDLTWNNENYTSPAYKIRRCQRIIRKEQADWLANTLLSTPKGYGIVISSHNCFSLNSVNQTDKKFAVDTAWTGDTQVQNIMKTDLIADLCNAYNNRTTIEEKVVINKKGHGTKDDGDYLNTQDDGDGEKYYYKINADFTNGVAKVLGFIGGHVHKDLVMKHNTYNLWGINCMCGGAISTDVNTLNRREVPKMIANNLAYDTITVTSWCNNRIGLARIGNTLTINGKHRDMEVINTDK